MDWRPKSPGHCMDLGIIRPKLGFGARATSTNHHNPSSRVAQPAREVPRTGCFSEKQQIDVRQAMQQECAEHEGEHNLWHTLFDRPPQAGHGGIIRHRHTPPTSRPGKQWRFCWLVCFRIRDKTDGFGTCWQRRRWGFGGGLLPRPRFRIPLRPRPTCTTSFGVLSHPSRLAA